MSQPPSLLGRLRDPTSGIRIVLDLLFVLFVTLAVPIAVGVTVALAAMLVLPEAWAMPLAAVPALLSAVLVLGAIGLQEHSPLTFGRERTVEATTFRNESTTCARCDDDIEQGLKRRYAEQVVVFGVPLYNSEWGENTYCLDCADPGRRPAGDGVSEPSRETVQATE